MKNRKLLSYWEYRRVLPGMLALSGIYLVLSLCFSFFSWRTIPALLLGVLFTVINSIAREWTMRRITSWARVGTGRLYLKSYLLRMTLAGLFLTAGFLWLDPFAVAVPMLGPNISYRFLRHSGREI